MRKEAPKPADKQIFTRTAAHTKAINVGFRHFRGGTRL